MKTSIQKANITDFDFLLNNLRDCDKQEILANMKEKSLKQHFELYKMMCLDNIYSVFINDKLVCMFGTNNWEIFSASIWMLSTKYLTKFNKTFLKLTQDIRKIAFGNNKKLFNFVYVENKPAIRYLKYIGADFKNVFIQDKKFQYFEIVR
jgi:alpha-tubulin suppressor-like RCC1 family protein